jgi:multidrug efflux system membrane fusion protein
MSVALLVAVLPALAGTPMKGVVLPFRQVEVSSPVASRILELKVQEGDAVKEGQPLAVLYGRLEELEMLRAKALLERREFEAKGTRRLFDSKIISEAKAMEARIDLDLARLQYETALEQVRLRTVLAPMAGVVVARAREVGESVTVAQPLFRILDLSRVVVQVMAEPEALGALAPGRTVRVRIHGAPGELDCQGLVSLIDPCANAEGRVRVKILVENPDGQIRSGLRASVDSAERP